MNQNISKLAATGKIKQFCAYQERCHSEVKDKLYGFGLHKNDVEEIVSLLVDKNYLNEQRFAIQFAGGRFRMKGWGRVKIKYELKHRNVSEICVRKALQSIPEDDYQKKLSMLSLQKWESLKSEKNIFTKRKKLVTYLLQKGFEADLCRESLQEIEQNKI